MWSAKNFRQKETSDFSGKCSMGRVGVVGLGSKVVFWAVFDIFSLAVVEAHVDQTKFPQIHALSYIFIRACGKAGNKFRRCPRMHS